jgi:hypothetical protein
VLTQLTAATGPVTEALKIIALQPKTISDIHVLGKNLILSIDPDKLRINAANFALLDLRFNREVSLNTDKGKMVDIHWFSRMDQKTKSALLRIVNDNRRARGDLRMLTLANCTNASEGEVMEAISELAKGKTLQSFKASTQEFTSLLQDFALKSGDETYYGSVRQLMEARPNLRPDCVEFWQHLEAMWTHLFKGTKQIYELLTAKAQDGHVPRMFGQGLPMTQRENAFDVAVTKAFTEEGSVLRSEMFRLAQQAYDESKKAKEPTAEGLERWYQLVATLLGAQVRTMDAAKETTEMVYNPNRVYSKPDRDKDMAAASKGPPHHKGRGHLAAPMIQEEGLVCDDCEGLSPMGSLSPTPVYPSHPNPKNGPQNPNDPPCWRDMRCNLNNRKTNCQSGCTFKHGHGAWGFRAAYDAILVFMSINMFFHLYAPKAFGAILKVLPSRSDLRLKTLLSNLESLPSLRVT